MEKKEEKKIILEQLQLLEKIRKEHEWVVVGQKEAEEEEKAEAELESEATESAIDKSERGTRAGGSLVLLMTQVLLLNE